jgi:drug/metabolite transporter (DMT)-like permease
MTWREAGRGSGFPFPLRMGRPSISERRYAVLMLVLANVLWGVSFPVIKAITLLHARLLPDAGAWFFAIYTVAPRFLIAVVLFAVWHGRRLRGVTRLELQQGILIGSFAAGGMLLQTDGLQFTAASTSAFLTQMYAVLIPVWLAFRVRHHRPGWHVWACCGLVLVGVAILGRFDWRTLHFGRGEWETLASSLFFMGQILWLEDKRFAANRPERLTFVVFVTEAAIFGVLALTLAPNTHALAAPWTSGAWLGLTLTLALLCTIGAFSLMNRWQPKITATEAGLVYCFEPIFGSVMALFLPAWFSVWAGIDYANEHVTWRLLAGGGLITLANIAIQLKPPVAETPPASPADD